jgi:CPA1 family monovalent cation:H+ antiporter
VIGLQLPEILRRLAGRSLSQLVWYAAGISLAVILIRIVWVYPATYLATAVFSLHSQG